MELEQQSKVNFIPCVRWVKKGMAKCNPEKVQLNKEELVRIINQTKAGLRIAEAEDGGESSMVTENANDEYNFEKYDEEDGNNAEQLLGISSLAEIPAEAEDHFSDSDDSEKEDDVIKPEDNLILAGRVEGDASILEVYVYNEAEESLYVHHDFLLPAFPLCIEWLDHEAGHPPGNYCAIGSMSPIIEVWDLDIINCLEPAFKLGRKPSRKKGLSGIGHTDAVLDLSWNKNYDHILASGSVDKSVLLWDLDQGEPATTINAFNDKVQCLEWHKLEAQTLLAGSCDQTVKVFDCRSPENHQTWQVSGETERIAWNPLEPFSFFAATSTGMVHYFDCRQGQVWSINAHEKEVTGLTISGQCPGLFLTASSDGLVKIWDSAESTQPNLVYEKDFSMGLVHCLQLCPDLPFVVAAGGDNKSNNFTVFDLQNIDVVKHRFESRSLVQLVSQETPK
ncbi:hypothetical protein ILUMI_24101 [Ignelater luminosus]|uniref:Periodic tryptophan protein 1 homolog n=1 Tax=Ignelater luminosus TaxID=2038154 RepID=A0A8K0C7N6_IGNLU|nr:hypothetical protein ILUMI_24101 [Ignelater luminosus]